MMYYMRFLDLGKRTERPASIMKRAIELAHFGHLKLRLLRLFV